MDRKPLQNLKTSCTLVQVVAVIFLALTIITQLNIISTRNPSFWWYFSKKTAPPPSLKLALPVSMLLLASTFIAGVALSDCHPPPFPPSHALSLQYEHLIC